jgi:hypothetical protein
MHKYTFTRVALTAAAFAAAVAPAGAAVVDRGHFAGETYGYGYSCGFPVEVAGEASGNYRLRDGGDGTFFSLDRIAFREVHTNTQTGEWFTITGRFANNETRARHVGGSLYEVRIVKAGQVAVITDSDGEVVARDRGAVRRNVLFDTGGDEEPGGEVVELLDLDFAGPHESFGNLCAIAEELTTGA